MKRFIVIFILNLCLNINAEENDGEETDMSQINQTMDDLKITVDNDELKLKTELRGTLDKIDKIVDMTFSSIDSHSIRTSWREGKATDRDLDFEKDISYYKLKETLDFPCKSVNFLFEIKSELEIYEFNAKRFLECYLRFHDDVVKEYLSDLVVEGVINILKSGYSNPISTFFSNLLIIEGPLKLKEELFAVFYKHVTETADLNHSYSSLIDILIKKTFNEHDYEHEAKDYIKKKSTTLTYFLYDSIIIYLDNNDVYLSAYDFIQPDSNMVNNFDSMNPVFISRNFKEALQKDLIKFKKIRDEYEETPDDTIYHKAYHHYVVKNIEILCKYLYKTKDC